MQEGDRVMVYDSPGHPLPHYLYAKVLTPSPAGALVIIEHPGNLSDGKTRYVAMAQIMTAKDALNLKDEAAQNAKLEADSERRRVFLAHVKHHEFIASELS